MSLFIDKRKRLGLILLVALSILPLRHSRAAITSVILTPAATTTLSNGLSYYLAGKPYTFRVQAVDPAVTQQSDWTSIVLQFRNNVPPLTVREACTININVEPATYVAIQTGVIVDNVVNNSANINNIDYSITLRFLWTAVEFRPIATNDVIATVTNTFGAVADPRAFNYGVISSVTIVNFAHTGVAADRRVNPWHDSFDVTGSVVYRADPLDPQTTIADRVATVTAGELQTVEVLRVNTIDTVLAPNAPVAPNDFNFTIPAQYFAPPATLGNKIWSVRARMSTPAWPPGVLENSIDPLVTAPVTLNVDRVEITGIQFLNGGGITVPPLYYRGVNLPGTQARVTARMQNGLGNVQGNITVYLRNTTGPIDDDIPILNLQPSGIGNITNPGDVVPAPITQTRTYQVQSITGGAYGGDLGALNGQNDPLRITVSAVPATPVIYWDNLDPPGANAAPFTAWLGTTTTAYSMTINWTPLTAPPDGDFDTYRVYYRRVGAPSFLMLDRTSGGTYANLALYTTGSIEIIDLQPLTAYEYYVSAIDVFGNVVLAGNETPTAPADRVRTTQPKTVDVTLTDGVLSYPPKHFDASKPGSSRPVRKTAIKVTFFIVTVEGQPDSANLILVKGDYNSYAVPPLAAGQELILGGALNPLYTLNTDYYRISCMKTAPNTWVAYIPDTNPFMQIGNTLSFALELIRSGARSYNDSTRSEVAPGDPNNEKWAFKISQAVATTFAPWPTRILNNVITRSNPVAYPSFYLTEDAFVTIRIYDIKGRPVVTLIDNLYQKGGQNIVAGGWNAVNRYNKKVGAGLYYIHIQARGMVSGKIILNSFKKVVVAK